MAQKRLFIYKMT